MNNIFKHAIFGITLFGALGLTACGEGSLELDHGSIRESNEQHLTSELMYLRTQEDAQQAFGEDGVAEFVPERAFFASTIMITADQAPNLEYRYRRVDGSWSDWEKAALEWSEDQFHSTNLELLSGATSLVLRTQDKLDFMRLEFSPTSHAEDIHEFVDDEFAGESVDAVSLTEDEVISQGIAISGQWKPGTSTINAGNRQSLSYDSAPSWNGGRNCSGTFTAGARELGNYLVNNFGGAKYFQGYNCRQIRGSSGMSMHGTGRAIDVFIPLARGQADNTLGDPVANWLMANAEAIGIQLIIWDRASYGPHRSSPKLRYYSGEHPHHDHLHIELTKEAAARTTSWFRNRGSASSPVDSSPSAPAGSCSSSTLGKTVANGEAVQVNYSSSCGSTCSWFTCKNGSWSCQGSSPGSASKTHPHASCQAPAPTPTPTPTPAATCYSKTLNKDIKAGEFVQMSYNSCGGTCQWAVCDSQGNWQCKAPTSGATKHGHAQCGGGASLGADACNSSTLGRKVAEGSRVQMAYNSCGGTCRWAECNNSSWTCVSGPANSSSNYPHASCR